MDLKPIETNYNGYRFRSRLEARWAVYFDAMGIEYEYEKEGYDLRVGYYLPDFWLPQVNMWAEVKGREFTMEERGKAINLAKVTGYPILRLIGLPDYVTYLAWLPSLHETDYLLSNYHEYLLDEKRFYSGTEFYGMKKNIMQVGVYELDGDSIKKGVVAAKSARFEYGETPSRTKEYRHIIQKPNLCEEEVRILNEPLNNERRLRQKQNEDLYIKYKTEVKNDISNETFCSKTIIREVMGREFQISPEAVELILSSEYPEKLLRYMFDNIKDDIITISPKDIDVVGFEASIH